MHPPPLSHAVSKPQGHSLCPAISSHSQGLCSLPSVPAPCSSFLFPLLSCPRSRHHWAWPSGCMSHNLTNPSLFYKTTKCAFLKSMYSEAPLRTIIPRLSVGYSYPLCFLAYSKPSAVWPRAHRPSDPPAHWDSSQAAQGSDDKGQHWVQASPSPLIICHVLISSKLVSLSVTWIKEHITESY